MQKDLANANISETKLLWFELSSDASIGIYLISSTTWSWYNCYFDLVSNALFWVNQGIFYLIHEKTKKTASYGIDCLDVAIFIWCLDLHDVWILLITY